MVQITETPVAAPLRHPSEPPLRSARHVAGRGGSSQSPQSPPDLTVVVPAYNEAQRLPATLEEVVRYLAGTGLAFEVLVVDDGSTDETVGLARAVAARDPRLGVLALPHRGKGAAVRAGMLAARGRLVVFCDADLPMPVEDLTRLAGATRRAPVVIATREGPGAQRTGEPTRRHLMGRVFNLLVRSLVVPGIRDTQCGLKCFTAESARQIFSRQTIDGFGFDVEVLYLARRLGYGIREVPIAWTHRPLSRVDPLRDTLRMLRDVVHIKWCGWRGRYAGSLRPGMRPA